jgi:hypothetical protein
MDSVSNEYDTPAPLRNLRPPFANTSPSSVPAAVYTTEHATNPYVQFLIDTKYTIDSGLRAYPVGGPASNAGVEIIREHGGLTTAMMKWTVERRGAVPDIPSHDVHNDNWVWLYSEITGANPFQANPNGDAGLVHRISGVHHYVLTAPMSESNTFPLFTTPFETARSSRHNINPAQWNTAIISAAHVQNDLQLLMPIQKPPGDGGA